jgi:hypothetical protein
MDAAFGSHTSQEDLELLAQVQDEVGLNSLLDGDQVHVPGAEKGGVAGVTKVDDVDG